MPKPKGRNRYTKAEVLAALREANGVKTHAARLLGCTRGTLSKYVKQYPDLVAKVHEIDEELVDLAETQLVQKVRDGHWGAIKFVLESKGAERGWTVKQTIEQTGQGVTMLNLGRDELEQLIRNTEGPTKRDDPPVH